MSNGRFDDIFSAASNVTVQEEPQPKSKPVSKPASKSTSKSSTKVPQSKSDPKAKDFWLDFEDKEDRIRLNVDISNALNDKLSEKAKRLGQSKSVLVRRLIEWALDDANE
jgi:Ribbon-helix-helix protein, copG family